MNKARLAKVKEAQWLKDDLENRNIAYAVQHLDSAHLSEVKTRRADMINRTYSAVKDRMTKGIAYWDHRVEE